MEEIFKDKWNLPFLISTIFIIIGAIINTTYHKIRSKIANHIFWLGIANWIPLFLIFWGLQPYLKSNNREKIVHYYLLQDRFQYF